MKLLLPLLALFALVSARAAEKPNIIVIGPPHSPTPLPVLTVPGAADAKANSWQQWITAP